MNTFSGSITLSILLLSLLNGISGRPNTRETRKASPRNQVLIQNVIHEANSCTPVRLKAERDNTVTHDIVCLLDTFKPFIDDLNQQNDPFELGCNIRLFNKFPELFRALVEIVSKFEESVLAMDYSEAMCTLKNIVQPGLNTTVKNFCTCATVEESAGCSSSQPLEISSGSNSKQCLLIDLHSTLRRLQIHLDGQDLTCRRASNDQKQALLNFDDAIHEYFNSLIKLPETSSILVQSPLPQEPCSYRGFELNMTDHVRSLYTLVAPLSNLTSSEAQLISGNLTEVILPIVQPLVDASFGEGFYERAVNSSTPLASSVSTLKNEHRRTVCFVNRLRVVYRNYFLRELRERDIVTQNDSCLQYSSPQ